MGRGGKIFQIARGMKRESRGELQLTERGESRLAISLSISFRNLKFRHSRRERSRFTEEFEKKKSEKEPEKSEQKHKSKVKSIGR